jgi:ATP-binding cassette subfamily C protein CydD
MLKEQFNIGVTACQLPLAWNRGNKTMNGTKPVKNKTALRWLRSQSRIARQWLLISVGMGVASGLLLAGQAHLLSRIVHDAFMEGVPRSRLTPMFVYLLAIIAVRAALGWWREIAGFKAGAAVRGEVRQALLNHLVDIGPVGISRLPAGSLVSNVLEQVEALHNFVALYLPQMALAALLPLVMLAFIFPISWAAGGVLLVAAPLIPLFMILVGMGAESISQKHFQALARMSAHFLDVLRGLPTLKLFGRSKDQVLDIQKSSRAYRMRTMAVLRVAFLSSAVLEFFSAISIALVAVYLGMYFLGYIEFGTFGKPLDFASGLFILLLAPDFFLPLRELGAHYHARADAVGAAEEILNVFDQTVSAAPKSTAGPAPPAPGTIQFQNICVQYDGAAQRGLKGLEITIAKGERVAVVGGSGAGKSTLIHLLLGFVAPSNGRILIDGRPLADMNIDSWRHHCAWIGQQPMLFSGSLRENIALAQPKATNSQIESAARRAGVLEFSDRWENGLDTQVGEQGQGLSMGQAQRVALARAFVKDAPLLLLDEPTASLDKETETQILSGLEGWSRHRTLLIATHRPAALALADRILLLNKGELIAQGEFDTLKKTHGPLLPGGAVIGEKQLLNGEI